jgi:hypothetical protein
MKFDFLFTQLGVGGTASVVAETITTAAQHRPATEATSGTPLVNAAPDDPDAGE